MQPYIFTGINVSDTEQMKIAINTLFQTSDADTMAGTLYRGIPTFQEAGLPVPIGFNEVMRPSEGELKRMNNFGNSCPK